MKIGKNLVAAGFAALVATGCMDLEVQHPGAPDRERALRTASDIEALVGGSYRHWYNTNTNTSSPFVGPILATMAYQHSATAANFGMVEFSSWPKTRVHHNTADVYYNEFAANWTLLYRAVSAATDGLRTLDEGGVTLPDSSLARVRAYGYFVLGLAHASAAILYDQGYVYDPSISVEDVRLQPYQEVMAAAMGYFDRAIQEATGKSFTIPELWTGRDIPAANLIRLVRSYKARYRAAVARTPAERAAVDWAAVIADVDAGITQNFTWNQRIGSGWVANGPLNMFRYGPWGQVSYQVLGMADQSGSYQRWIAKDPWERHPNLSEDRNSEPFLIITPDLRFPRGTTIAEQCNRRVTGNVCSTAGSPAVKPADERGRIFELTADGGGAGAQWNRPDRGEFRWSYYRPWIYDQWATPATNRHDWPEMKVVEMQLLKAEGLFRTNNRAGAATIINQTRVANGLNATDANGTNTSCVPKLPNGQCGDLFEMLKWEVRLETIYSGLHMAPWYFHGRGWGDLAEGSFLHLPVPGREMELLLQTPYTFGGTFEGASPVGTYGY